MATKEQEARLAALILRIQNAPDPEDQRTPKAQRQAEVERQNRANRFAQFDRALSVERKWIPIGDVVRSDLADMRAAEAHFTTTVETLEASLPEHDRERLRYEKEAVREAYNALRAVRCGIEWMANMEMIPPTLYDFLAKDRGWRARDGAFWRGSVVALEERLAEIDQRLGPARATIEEEMARPLEDEPVSV